MQNTYETIETLGLTEVGASLPIPSGDVLTGQCIGETLKRSLRLWFPPDLRAKSNLLPMGW